jgi:GH24 family phage-related lysozyme (muramidase)
MLLSERALKLIVDFEGLNQPGRWPGGASGITLGYGYDLGHVTPAQFAADWAACFTAEQMARLRRAIGKTGAAARALAASLADIRCAPADARRVLVGASLPVYVARTRRAFPGFDVLPLDVQGALVSLVYNRGTRMTDSPGTNDRREMRAIRGLVAGGMVAGIAEQLRLMKRLWVGKGLDGLLRRRDAEAALVESAIGAMLRALRAIPGRLRRAAASLGARRARAPKGAPGSAAPRRAAGGEGRGRRGAEGLADAAVFGASRKAIVIAAPPGRTDARRMPRPRPATAAAGRRAAPRPAAATRARRRR